MPTWWWRCTGAVRPVVSLAGVHHALAAARRSRAASVGDAAWACRVTSILRWPDYRVWVVDVDGVQHEPSARARLPTLGRRHIVAAEVTNYLVGRQLAGSLTDGTLRQRAAEVIGGIAAPTDNRLPDLQVSSAEWPHRAAAWTSCCTHPCGSAAHSARPAVTATPGAARTLRA